MLAINSSAFAEQAVVVSPPLEKCLKRADDLPDMAAAEASVWIKKDGGNDAHLCRAFAQVNRGMHADAAREFWYLGSFYDKHDPHRAILMHNMAGQEFLTAHDIKNADTQFISTLKIVSNEPTALTGRARVLMVQEKYWDALDLLTAVLKTSPDNLEALRQRGKVWSKLGNKKKSEDDFDQAADLEEKAQSK